jgi:glycosyltransferase involved in cell wall biosynthesis
MSDVVFINVASFYEGKNQEKIIEVWNKMKNDVGVLLFVGDGPTLERCKSLVTDLIKNKIIFLGRREDVFDLLLVSDIFIYPSNSEGMSNSIIEAMSAGLPCIVNNISQNTELIKNNINGIVVDINNIQSFIDAIRALQNSLKLRTKLGKEAKNFIQEKLSLEKTGILHRSLFKNIIDGVSNKYL